MVVPRTNASGMCQNRSPFLDVQTTSFRCRFIHVSHCSRCPLNVSPFFVSTSCSSSEAPIPAFHVSKPHALVAYVSRTTSARTMGCPSVTLSSDKGNFVATLVSTSHTYPRPFAPIRTSTCSPPRSTRFCSILPSFPRSVSSDHPIQSTRTRTIAHRLRPAPPFACVVGFDSVRSHQAFLFLPPFDPDEPLG